MSNHAETGGKRPGGKDQGGKTGGERPGGKVSVTEFIPLTMAVALFAHTKTSKKNP